MKNTKKILALVLCCVMLLGVLAGCGESGNQENPPATGTNHELPEIVGSLLLNLNGCVEVAFDKDGKVLNLQELDHDGGQLLSDYSGYLQTSCLEVVKDLTAISVSMELLNSEFHHIVIMERPNSQLPSETFLEDLAAAAVEASDIFVTSTVVTAQELDADGNVSAKKAYDLLQHALNVEKFTLVDSNEELHDGVYSFEVVAESYDGIFLVEAATGYVYEGDIEYIEEDYEDELVNADEEFNPETETTSPVATEKIPEDTAVAEEG